MQEKFEESVFAISGPVERIISNMCCCFFSPPTPTCGKSKTVSTRFSIGSAGHQSKWPWVSCVLAREECCNRGAFGDDIRRMPCERNEPSHHTCTNIPEQHKGRSDVSGKIWWLASLEIHLNSQFTVWKLCNPKGVVKRMIKHAMQVFCPGKQIHIFIYLSIYSLTYSHS